MEDVPEMPVGRRRLVGIAGLAFLALALSLLTGARVVTAKYAPASSPFDPPSAARFPNAPKLIEGQVLDAATRSPIAGASIHSGPEEIRTDAEGRFT
ncbi:MAG: hypothetical protein ACREJI_09095, partial [Candidatus Methylomirabilales bacterium]